MEKIWRLSEVSIEKQNEFYSKYNRGIKQGFIKEPFKNYNFYGLKFDIDYLNNIKHTILLFPLEIVANYCDAVCKMYVDNQDISLPTITSDA